MLLRGATSKEHFDLRRIAEDLKWTWDEFRKLPRETITVDIHCVTKWSKLDAVWTGVSVDTLLEGSGKTPVLVALL